jgi:hypothetical protein
MKKLLAILALAILLVPGIVLAQPPGCNWSGGDPSIWYGFNNLTLTTPPGAYTSGFHQPGPDTVRVLAGTLVRQQLRMYNSSNTWVPSCTTGPDTFCTVLSSSQGWVTGGTPAIGSSYILALAGSLYQFVQDQVPCSAAPGTVERVSARMAYQNNGTCAPECGDCNDPNVRTSDGLARYNADTLYIIVIAPPFTVPITIDQDSLFNVDQGQTQAYVPFSICNLDNCFTTIGYHVWSKGHIGTLVDVTSTVTVPGNQCRDVYGVLDAGLASVCDLDTLTIIVWGGSPELFMYDTCVQIVHVISPEPVPLFTVPVVTILVLALILAAAVFMRRRAVSRA